jgi:hypothetical protein
VPLTFDSPRFPVRHATFEDIEGELDRVGHVVLDGLWNQAFLSRLRDLAEKNFKADETGNTHLPDVRGIPGWREQEFFSEVERSGLPAILRHFLKGDFVISENERVLRRADAAIAGVFSGLHFDGQLRCCSDEGVNSKREFTIWTPLTDCSDDDTPRLLLLHRGQNFADVFSERDQISDGGIKYLPTQLRPTLEADGLNRAASQLDQMFDRIYASKQCYAPRIPLGSTVLFEHNIIHGSYRRSQMTVPRYSLDFRAVGVYRRSEKNQHFGGRAFSSAAYPYSAELPTKEKVLNVSRGAAALQMLKRSIIRP